MSISYPGRLSRRRPVACPRMLKYRLSIARRSRSVCAFLSRSEPGMDRAYRVIKLSKQIVRIIESPIREDIHFTGLQHAKAPQFAVELVDITELLPKVVNGNTARNLQTLGMIRDADIFVTAVARGLRHVCDGINAVARS